MCDRVLGLDRRVELLYAIQREAIFDGKTAQRIQPQLVLKRFLGGGLELSPGSFPGAPRYCSAARISSSTLVTSPLPASVDVRSASSSCSTAYRIWRSYAAPAIAVAIRARPGATPAPFRMRARIVSNRPRHYRATSVTSRPFRTTPMTTVLPATSPLPSNAIVAGHALERRLGLDPRARVVRTARRVGARLVDGARQQQHAVVRARSAMVRALSGKARA